MIGLLTLFEVRIIATRFKSITGERAAFADVNVNARVNDLFPCRVGSKLVSLILDAISLEESR